MTLRTQQVLSVVVGALVAVLNGTLGWRLNPDVVVAIVLAFAALAVTIGQVEAAHGTLAQDWAKLEPRLIALLDALEAAKPQASADAPAPEAKPQG